MKLLSAKTLGSELQLLGHLESFLGLRYLSPTWLKVNIELVFVLALITSRSLSRGAIKIKTARYGYGIA